VEWWASAGMIAEDNAKVTAPTSEHFRYLMLKFMLASLLYL
jgi:hypothetical protein